MRWIALGLLGWSLAAPGVVAPAAAQAWLTVGGADGSFRIEMPVPFDLPSPVDHPDGTITFACVHETPELSLRFEVLDAPTASSGQTSVQGVRVSRIEDGSRILQTRVHVVGQRTFRLLASSTREFEGDPMIHRFLASVRLLH